MSDAAPLGGDTTAPAAPPSDRAVADARSAGRALRRAREAQGLQIDALAASLKVSARKIELLEADRYDELPDATFTRALAQTLCRSLKVDAASVLAMLPPASGHRIEQVSEGLNAPFRDRSARFDGLAWETLLKAAWAPVLLLALAVLIWLLPEGSIQSGAGMIGDAARSMSLPKWSAPEGPPSPAVVAEAPSATEPVVPQPAVETVFSAPPLPGAGAASAAAHPLSPAGPLELRASAESWVEVKDARERILMSRSLQPGEAVTLDGALPMRVKIGNAAVTELRFRGALVDIVPMTSENIARIELK